jgi:hypothetical protein
VTKSPSTLALEHYLSLRSPGFDPRRTYEHFEAFKPCAEAIFGDMARKFQLYLFPKVEAAGASGITIGNVRVVAIAEDYGCPPGCHVEIGGVPAFRITTLHTRAFRGNSPRDTISVYRAPDERSVAHATITPAVDAAPWAYKCHDGPGALPGIVEACRAVRPFIAQELASDTAPALANADQYAPYLAMVRADGGLPGVTVNDFGKAVLDDGIGPVAEWVSRALRAVAAKTGTQAAWPDRSLVYYDCDECLSVIAEDSLVGMVHYSPERDQDPTATVTLVRQDETGRPAAMSIHRIPLDGPILAEEVARAIGGGRIGGYPSMTFDFATQAVSAENGYLEKDRHLSFAVAIDTALIDWNGVRSEAYVDTGVVDTLEAVHHVNAGSSLPRPPTP